MGSAVVPLSARGLRRYTPVVQDGAALRSERAPASRPPIDTLPLGGQKRLLLPVDQISPNSANPRRTFNERGLDELAASIQRWGQLQPVVVRKVDGGYQLVCG